MIWPTAPPGTTTATTTTDDRIGYKAITDDDHTGTIITGG